MANTIKSDENKMNKDSSPNVVPQSYKGMTLEEARLFLRNTMDLFYSLAPMTDLKTLYEAGKQLSRLYFDCSNHQKELAEILLELEFPEYAIKTMKKLNNMGVFKNDDIWFSSFYLYNICWNYSDASFEFATALALCGLPNLLSLNIGHKPYLDNLSSRNVYYLIKASLSIIHNICRYPGSCLYFRSESVRCSLKNLMDREEDFIRVVASLCLASVAGETDAGSIFGISTGSTNDENSAVSGSQPVDVLKSIVTYVKKARASERARFMGFRSHELLQGVRAATTTESGRRRFLNIDIDGLNLLRESLAPIIGVGSNGSISTTTGSPNTCSEEDITECLEIASNLAVAGHVPKILDGAGVDINCLRTLCSTTQNTRIRSVCEDLVHSLTTSTNTEIEEQLVDTDPDSIPNVVLVYAPVNRFSVTKIRDRLQTDRPGLVRLLPLQHDQSSSTGTLQQSLQQLRQSDIVVVCLSEAVKALPRCQLQLQYAANRLRIPILALLVQQKYKSDVWLSQLLADTQCFDLSLKRDFENNWESFLVGLGECVAERRAILLRKKQDELAKQQAVALAAASVKQEKASPPPQQQPFLNNEDHLHDNHLADPISTRSSGPDYTRFNGAEEASVPMATPAPPKQSGGPSGEGPITSYLNDSSNQQNVNTTPNQTNLNKAGIIPPVANLIAASATSVTTTTTVQDLPGWLERHQLSHITPILSRASLASEPNLLVMYRHIKHTAPNFFYESLEKHLKLDIADILRFSRAIDDL